MAQLLPPLLLTGGPAVGKTVTARGLAESTPRTAYVDVDDVRQLIKSGAVAPSRTVYLTDREFESLHLDQAPLLAVDHQLDVTHLDQAEQLQRVQALWTPRH